MRLEQYLNEEWFDTVQGYGNKHFDVFRNPSQKDYSEINSDFIRFIAIRKTKSLYMWDGTTVIHADVWKIIPNNGVWSRKNIKMFDKQLLGIAYRSGSSWIMEESDSYDYYGSTTRITPSTDEMKKMYKWVNKWIKIDAYFNTFKR